MHATPCQRYRTVRHMGLGHADEIEVVTVRIVCLRMATYHNTVAKNRTWPQELRISQKFHRCAAVLAQGLVHLHQVLARVDLHRDAQLLCCLTGSP